MAEGINALKKIYPELKNKIEFIEKANKPKEMNVEPKFKMKDRVKMKAINQIGTVSFPPRKLAGKWFYQITPDIPNEDFRELTKPESDLEII